jgi:hypothetical protein
VFDQLARRARPLLTRTSVADVLLAVHAELRCAITGYCVCTPWRTSRESIAGNLARSRRRSEAVVEAGSRAWPPVFRILKTAGDVSIAEMRRVFNLGIGMIAVVARDDVDEVRRVAERATVRTWIIGEIKPGKSGVRFSER